MYRSYQTRMFNDTSIEVPMPTEFHIDSLAPDQNGPRVKITVCVSGSLTARGRRIYVESDVMQLAETLRSLSPDLPIFSKVVTASPPPVLPVTAFENLLRDDIESAITRLSISAQSVLSGQQILLTGPSGCGKTSAMGMLAANNNMLFVPVDGKSSWADNDIVGMKVNGQTYEGPISQAFAAARTGSQVLLFFDEVFRFNQRALDVLMGPMVPVPVKVARAMGIQTDVPVRIVKSPLWGMDWAPAANVVIVAAGNPWGNDLDPALRRRFDDVIQVYFDRQVLKSLSAPIRNVIDQVWRNLEQNNDMALTIEYQAIARMQAHNDVAILKTFERRLRAFDPSEADTFKLIVQAQPQLQQVWNV